MSFSSDDEEVELESIDSIESSSSSYSSPRQSTLIDLIQDFRALSAHRKMLVLYHAIESMDRTDPYESVYNHESVFEHIARQCFPIYWAPSYKDGTEHTKELYDLTVSAFDAWQIAKEDVDGLQPPERDDSFAQALRTRANVALLVVNSLRYKLRESLLRCFHYYMMHWNGPILSEDKFLDYDTYTKIVHKCYLWLEDESLNDELTQVYHADLEPYLVPLHRAMFFDPSSGGRNGEKISTDDRFNRLLDMFCIKSGTSGDVRYSCMSLFYNSIVAPAYDDAVKSDDSITYELSLPSGDGKEYIRVIKKYYDFLPRESMTEGESAQLCGTMIATAAAKSRSNSGSSLLGPLAECCVLPFVYTYQNLDAFLKNDWNWAEHDLDRRTLHKALSIMYTLVQQIVYVFHRALTPPEATASAKLGNSRVLRYLMASHSAFDVFNVLFPSGQHRFFEFPLDYLAHGDEIDADTIQYGTNFIAQTNEYINPAAFLIHLKEPIAAYEGNSEAYRYLVKPTTTGFGTLDKLHTTILYIHGSQGGGGNLSHFEAFMAAIGALPANEYEYKYYVDAIKSAGTDDDLIYEIRKGMKQAVAKKLTAISVMSSDDDDGDDEALPERYGPLYVIHMALRCFQIIFGPQNRVLVNLAADHMYAYMSEKAKQDNEDVKRQAEAEKLKKREESIAKLQQMAVYVKDNLIPAAKYQHEMYPRYRIMETADDALQRVTNAIDSNEEISKLLTVTGSKHLQEASKKLSDDTIDDHIRSNIKQRKERRERARTYQVEEKVKIAEYLNNTNAFSITDKSKYLFAPKAVEATPEAEIDGIENNQTLHNEYAEVPVRFILRQNEEILAIRTTRLTAKYLDDFYESTMRQQVEGKALVEESDDALAVLNNLRNLQLYSFGATTQASEGYSALHSRLQEYATHVEKKLRSG